MKNISHGRTKHVTLQAPKIQQKQFDTCFYCKGIIQGGDIRKFRTVERGTVHKAHARHPVQPLEIPYA